jgi:hypothetical protein
VRTLLVRRPGDVDVAPRVASSSFRNIAAVIDDAGRHTVFFVRDLQSRAVAILQKAASATSGRVVGLR